MTILDILYEVIEEIRAENYNELLKLIEIQPLRTKYPPLLSVKL